VTALQPVVRAPLGFVAQHLVSSGDLHHVSKIKTKVLILKQYLKDRRLLGAT
jgi:hypothetical protein